MKFLLEFVSCCGCATTTAAKNDSVNGSVVLELGPSPISPLSEETISLVSSQRRYRRRKRGRVGSSGCCSAAGGGEWRPSLSSIDEDHVVMIERRRKIEVKRTVKRKGSLRGGSGDIGRDRTFSDDSGIPFLVMPEFSPTPFMF
ncbi:hypothetical protein HS088_TW21G00133 [Tripterygium wilfordii]|uniref:Uncharacterized protein n=1 Tax=Tripterygium wilfordii TaxID=458696 RepID=A0A7J7C1K1_TRIWF|nr:uncharacterized protein LOC119988800 [Tripterygium wilfordii]KAF5727991.1 hypothetical protein HS088_TW21G00133 [Tripterygium wilfordii]